MRWSRLGCIAGARRAYATESPPMLACVEILRPTNGGVPLDSLQTYPKGQCTPTRRIHPRVERSMAWLPGSKSGRMRRTGGFDWGFPPVENFHGETANLQPTKPNQPHSRGNLKRNVTSAFPSIEVTLVKYSWYRCLFGFNHGKKSPHTPLLHFCLG